MSIHHDPVDTDTQKVTAAYIYVTPEIASRWLESNKVNRKIRPHKVAQYARDMQSGRWTVSNDDICFDDTNALLNGQHRLLAVVRSGETILMGVKRNVPREAMDNMDSGAGRSASDMLGMAGEINSPLLASTVRQAVLYDSDRIYQDTKSQDVSRGEINDYLDANPEIRQSVSTAQRHASQIDCRPTALALAHRLIWQHNNRPVADFYLEQLATRADEPSGSAVHAVDSRLREVRRNRSSYLLRNYVYLLIKGWNYYAVDQPAKSLAMAPKVGTKFRIPKPAQWAR